MKNYFARTIIVPIFILFVFTSITNAQNLSTSTGRSNATTLEYDEMNYKAVERIRKFLNEGKFDAAVNRANRFIKNNVSKKRSGIERTELEKEVYNCLCVGLAGQGKAEDAMKACNESIRYTPKHWESLKTRATLYYMTQDFPKSLEDFTLALEHAPDNNEAISDVLKQNIGVVKSKLQ